MTSAELLQVIRRDIGERLRFTLGFRISNHYAQNIKDATEVAHDIERWIDDLMKDNLTSEESGYSEGGYAGTREDWVARCYLAEGRLEKIREIVK